jgi:Rrf2 family iron-sulfur cluster assembly transcriptional regulator
MKLSSRSRYGTRMMVDLAQHYNEGPVPIGEIARRQDISLKYLEQLLIPLKKANFIKSARGAKGGHMLSQSPEEITIGQIVEVLEGGIDISDCLEDAGACQRSSDCLTRGIWESATRVMYEKLNSITLSDVVNNNINH